MNKIYLDHAATTPVDERVLEVMLPYFSLNFHNPGALYQGAVLVQQNIEKARQTIASILHARSKEIYFLDGATQANNLVIKGVVDAWNKENKDKKAHIIISAIEHSSVYELCNELELDCTVLSVNQKGRVDLRELKEAIKEHTALVSIGYANGEIGSIEDIKGIAKTIRHYRKHNNSIYPYFHSDAVQAATFCNINVLQLGVDALTISGSKIYGPKKIAALYLKEGIRFQAQNFGGSQEKGMNPGTENVPYIMGLAEALTITQEIQKEELERLSELKDFLLYELKNFNCIINTPKEEVLPHIVNVTFRGVSSEELVLRLDAYGISCASKSACASGQEGDSHVILAFRDVDTGSLRFSLGRSTTKNDIQYLISSLQEILDLMNI